MQEDQVVGRRRDLFSDQYPHRAVFERPKDEEAVLDWDPDFGGGLTDCAFLGWGRKGPETQEGQK
jgi:hypothetical protein